MSWKEKIGGGPWQEERILGNIKEIFKKPAGDGHKPSRK